MNPISHLILSLVAGFLGGVIHRSVTSSKARQIEASGDKAIGLPAGTLEDLADQAEPVVTQAAVGAVTSAASKVIPGK